MESRVNKVLLISLDGATWSVLNPLIEQGCMPNLQTLMSQSVCSELESVVPPVTAPAWTSFMTGKHPNKHGIFDFAQFDPAHYRFRVNNSHDIKSTTLWQLLSSKGKRVIVLNLPYTYPTYEVNGIMVAGWDAPLTDAPFSYPADVSTEILRQFPDYKENLWVSELRPLSSNAQFDEFTQRIKVGFEQQARIAMDLLGKQEWDVFMVHFQQTDWVQHKLWTYIEKGCNNPNNHDPKIDITRGCYRHFDNFVGQLIKSADRFDPAIILLSDHGFGRLMGNIPANAYLKEWGYLGVQESSKERLGGIRNVLRKSPYAPVRKLYRAAVAAKNHFASAPAVQKHDSWAHNAQGVMSSRAASWEWTRTKAAMIYAYQMGFIYINLASRGPRGIVQPGAEYEAIVADIIRRCKRDILHSETGDSLLLDAVRGSEIYPPADNGIIVPDIVLIPRDGYNFSFSLSLSSPRLSEEGTHRHNGIFVMKSDAVAKVTDFHPNLIDLAPTILHLLGLPVPSDMDGRALEEILPSDWQVNYEEADNRTLSVTDNYSHEEADIVAQRLKGLGYLD